MKKLIKYDQHLLCTCKESNELSGSSYIETSPETFRTSNSTSLRTGNEYSHEEGHKIADTHEHMKQKYVTCTRSLVHTVQSGKKLTKIQSGHLLYTGHNHYPYHLWAISPNLLSLITSYVNSRSQDVMCGFQFHSISRSARFV